MLDAVAQRSGYAAASWAMRAKLQVERFCSGETLDEDAEQKHVTAARRVLPTPEECAAQCSMPGAAKRASTAGRSACSRR
ncbi:hypothetical protein [Streptomyces sp. NPDC056512]|uniref:hypothetical protein n=1 Tax=Streptomyces sp. NPDC056512 TaxID=3345846 RepID=UPI0036B4ED2B